MANELTGIRSGDGAKMKAEVGEDHVVFRGAIKAEVPFEEIVAEARGTLLVLSFRGNSVELGAGSRAAQLAARIRSPPSRLDRFGIQVGMTAATAGPFDAAFKAELASRATVEPGVPKRPVEALFLAVESTEHLAVVPKVRPLVAPGGSLWVVYPKQGKVRESQVVAAGRVPGWTDGRSAAFSASLLAREFVAPG